MITNILGKFWGNNALLEIKENLPDGFELKLYTLFHKCIKNHSITFNERLANSFTITYGDQFEIINLDSNLSISYVSDKLDNFIKKHKPKATQPTNINKLRELAISNIKKVLNINNDVIFYDNNKLSFELNLYTPVERKRILELLSTIDEFTPEVFIDVTLNNSTIEQLNVLNDRLLEVDIIN